MRFLRGNGTCMMMVSMPMRSPHTATPCGGTGDSRGVGAGARLGITAAGIHPVSGTEAIGEDGIIITIGIMRHGITTLIIRTTHGQV